MLDLLLEIRSAPVSIHDPGAEERVCEAPQVKLVQQGHAEDDQNEKCVKKLSEIKISQNENVKSSHSIEIVYQLMLTNLAVILRHSK